MNGLGDFQEDGKMVPLGTVRSREKQLVNVFKDIYMFIHGSLFQE